MTTTTSRPAAGATVPVPDGPTAYRLRLRRWGPLMGLAVPAGAIVVAFVLYRVSPCDGIACVENLTVWLLAAMAVPTALLWGLPIEAGAGRYAGAAVTSALVWAAVGHLAAYRATRRSLATWRTWWTEYAWFAGAIWIGVGVGVYVIRSYAL
jgi:phosphatidylserine synthase